MQRLAMISALALVSFLPMQGAAGSVSMPSFWRYAHPEAKALIGIEWSRIVHSPIGQEVRKKLEESEMQGMEGMDLLDSIDRILISSPGNPAAGNEGQPPVVIAVQGKFDLAKVRELAAGKMTGSSVYKSVEILEQQESGQQTMGLGLVSDRLVLVGDIGSVEAAIDHYQAGDPGQATNPLFSRAAEVAAGNDIWLVAKASPSDFAKGGFQQAQFLNDVDRFEAGLSVQSGLGIQFNLGTKTEQSANELAAGLQMMLGMMLAAQQQKPGMPNLSEKLRITNEQNTVRVAMSLDQSELEQSIQQLAGSMTPGTGAAPAGKVQARAKVGGSGQWSWERTAPKPQPQVITIWGLEEGKREIPLGQ